MNLENKFSVELEKCGGLDLIEPLQMHANHQIYERALRILEQYFQEEEELNFGGGANQTATPGLGF